MKEKLSQMIANQPLQLANSGAFVSNTSTVSN